VEREDRVRGQALNTEGFKRLPDIVGDDDVDTALLLQMAKSARDYITSFDWCPPIKAIHLASGVGGIVAVFLFEFDRKIQGTDDQLWVVVGDLPTAYLVVEPKDGPAQALERYCERGTGELREVFPVSAEPTPENAELLEKRIAFFVGRDDSSNA
jgi:hypothetical protein